MINFHLIEKVSSSKLYILIMKDWILFFFFFFYNLNSISASLKRPKTSFAADLTNTSKKAVKKMRYE